MGLLLSCWLLVATILIPSGFGRWTRLSYFVHPVVLLFCELYIVSKHLLRSFVFLLLLPFKLVFWIIVFVFRQIRTSTAALISILVRVIEVTVDSGEEQDEEYFEAVPAEDPTRSVALRNPWISSRKRRFESDEEEEEFFPAPSGEDSVDHGVVFQMGKRKRDEELEDGKSLVDGESESGTASPQFNSLTRRDQSRSLFRGKPEHQIASRRFRPSARRDWSSLLTSGEPENQIPSPQFDSRPTPLIGGDPEKEDAPLPSNRLILQGESPVDPEPEPEPEAERLDSSYSLNTIRRRRRGSHRAVIGAVEGEREEHVAVPAATPEPPRDAFHEEYEKRMAWFDRVNQERNGEASELLRLLLQNPSFRVEDDIRRLQGTVYHGLLRSMESSLEMVYVGQTCLSWEALHHQHVRAKALLSSGEGDGVPWEPTVGKFKLFWEILERYLENEGVESCRRWNYSRSRLSAAKPLQIPEVSGNERRRDGTPAVREVVSAVERAIDVFWDFLQRDDHRPAGRLRRLLWVEPQAEDPGDLYLLEHLKKTFRKKERQLEKLLERRGRWWKAMSTSAAAASRWLNPQDYFAAIEIKLAGRVLGMPVISTQQLQWCEKKLARLDIRSSRVLRSPRDDDGHFPYS